MPTAATPVAAPMARLRNYFLTGLVIAAPLFLTVYITWSFVDWIDSWVEPLIPAAYRPDSYLPLRRSPASAWSSRSSSSRCSAS